MACGKAFPWFGCGDCCTHRLVTDTSAVEWSRNAGERAFCDVCHEVVFDAWHFGDIYYLLTATKCGDGGAPSVDSRNRVQAWDEDGERLWVSDVLNDEQATVGRICSDGTDVWVTVGGDTPFVYRLDALDGDVLYSSLEFDYAINYLCPDGAGKVWLAHLYQSDGDGDGFVSLWSDGTISTRFGGRGATPIGGASDLGNATAYSIVADGDTLYVGHTWYRTADFPHDDDDYCNPIGFVSRYDEESLVWISVPKIINLSPYADPPPQFPPLEPLIAVDGGFVYFALRDGSGYGALDVADGMPQWIREIDRAIPIDTPCTGRREPIRDFDAKDGKLWIAVNRWLYQLDSSGVVLDSVTHSATDYGICNHYNVHCVTANDDGGALLGGIPAPCDNPANEEQDSSAVECAECNESDPQFDTPFDWCETNACGSVTTTGRRKLAECPLAQSPPCEGPLQINYTCGETSVSETIDMVASAADCDGAVTWEGSGENAFVSIQYHCDGEIDVEVEIAGCTVTVDSAELICDGPFGYAAVSFTFSGTCTGCDLNGCGILNGEECDTGVMICCDEPFPASLTATLSAASCAALHGVTVPLTYVGVSGTVHTWEGTLTIAGCGECTFQFAINNGIACEYSMGIKRNDFDIVVWGSFDASGDLGSIDCPFVSAEFTGPIPDCASAMDCTGDLTGLVA